MDIIQQKLFAASLRTDLPTLDLHGVRPDQAQDRIEIFLYKARGQTEAVKIIYGIGTGRLAHEVASYLQQHPLVATIQAEAGHCLVLIAQ